MPRSSPNKRSSPPSVAALAVVAAAVVAAGIATPRPAHAQDQAAIEKLVQLNKRAMDDLDTADFEAAKKTLLDAERAGKKAHLESHPVMARTYIHLGAVYLMGFKDKTRAQQYFSKALDIQPDIRVDKNLNIAAVQEAFAAAQQKKGATTTTQPPGGGGGGGETEPGEGEGGEPPAGGGGGGTTKPRVMSAAEPELPAQIQALDCPYPEDTPPDKKLVLRCAAAPSLKVAGATLHYKAKDMKDFEELAMTKSKKGWWTATIPKKHVSGHAVQFYFEGVDATGNPVITNGRPESPNLIAISSGEQHVKKREDILDIPVLGTTWGNRRFWIGIGLGVGFGFPIGGKTESVVLSYMNQTPASKVTGFGLDGLGQLAPEFGIMLTPDWAVSIEGRMEWIPQAKNVARFTASGAQSVLVRVLHYTKQDRLRFFFGGGAGGGEGARMTVAYPDPERMYDIKDTIVIGPFLVGGTAGILYEIGTHLSWMAETNIYVGLPKVGFNADLNTALQINFGTTAKKPKVDEENSVSGSVDDDPKD